MDNYKNKHDIEELNSIITRVAKSLGVDRGVKEITLINMWPEVIGPRFKDNTKAVSVIKKGNYNILLIAVSSATVAQELFFFKKDIINKISKLAKSLNLNIRDLNFNTKIWAEVNNKKSSLSNNDNIIHFYVKNPSDEELKYISVPENIINSIKESLKSQDFISDEMKDRIMYTIIRDIKTQIWRKNNGFPCCIKCGIPVNYYNPDKEVLCPSCKYLK